jgi:hypothetical protein
LRVESQPGDQVGLGQAYRFTQADGVLGEPVLYPEAGFPVTEVRFDFLGREIGVSWSLQFNANGHRVRCLCMPLVPGNYVDAVHPGVIPDRPWLAFEMNGRRGKTLLGRFTVLEAVFDYAGPATRLVRFFAEFEQHSEGAEPALFGRMEYAAPDSDSTEGWGPTLPGRRPGPTWGAPRPGSQPVAGGR